MAGARRISSSSPTRRAAPASRPPRCTAPSRSPPQGRRVAALDLDTRQRTLGRYLDNRAATMKRLGLDLPMPAYETFDPDKGESARGGDRAARRRTSTFVVIDTPGRDDPACPRGDGPRRHAGHADQRQLRRPRPDRRGRRRDLPGPPAELLRRAGLEQPHPARQDPRRQRRLGRAAEPHAAYRGAQHAPRRRGAGRAVAPGRLPGHSRASASGSSIASCSPRA